MMTAVEFANTVTDLPPETQSEFFEELKKILSDEEYTEAVKFISLIGLFKSPEKYKALRSAICEKLFGMEIPFSVKTLFDA